jgi:hypothetical protein
LFAACAGDVFAAGQTGGVFRVAADVFLDATPPLASGSVLYQMSSSIEQDSVAGAATFGGYRLDLGFQPMTDGFDTDGDGLPDDQDEDDDGDRIPDIADANPYDTDNDGANNIVADEDDDNDRLADRLEWAFGTSPVLPNTDGDAHDDYEEWIAGTDGRDPNDYFAILDIAGQGTGATRVTWLGVAGRRYEVCATNRLGTPLDEWAVLWSTNVLGTGNVTYDDPPLPPPSPVRFFRLTVSRP